MPSYPIILRTSDSRFFAVRDAGPDLDHCCLGVPVKKTRTGFVPRANARERLVRRAGCRVVGSDP